MKLLLQIIVALATAAVGILLAALLLHGFHVEFAGFLAAVAVYAVANAVLGPIVARAGEHYAPALMSGIGVITTFIALLITTVMPGGISIADVSTWLMAGLMMWLTTSLGGWILFAALRKRYLDTDTSDDAASASQRTPSTPEGSGSTQQASPSPKSADDR